MDEALRVIEKVRAAGIRLWVRDDQLHYEGPKSALTPELRTEILQRKSDLMQQLRSAAESVDGNVSYPALEPFVATPLVFQKPFLKATGPKGWIRSDVANSCQILRRISGALDRAALQRAIAALVERHHLLSGRIDTQPDTPCLVYEQGRSPAMRVVDLRDEEATARPSKAMEILREAIWLPIDVSISPSQISLISTSDEEHIFAWVFHHAICDADAALMIAQELDLHYSAFARGLPKPDLPAPVQYAEYCEGVSKWLAEPAGRKVVEYWRDQLRGLRPTQLPDDFAAEARPASQAQHIPFALPPDLGLRLSQYGRDNRVTLTMLLVAAQALVLAHLNKSEEATISVVTSGRGDPRLDRTLGLLATNIPHRVAVKRGQQLSQAITEARDVALATRAHSALPGHLYFELMTDGGGSDVAPWFNLIQLPDPGEEVSSEERLGSPIQAPPQIEYTDNRQGTPTPYGMFVGESGGQLSGFISFSSSRYRPETVIAFLMAVEAVLRAVVDRPQILVEDLLAELPANDPARP